MQMDMGKAPLLPQTSITWEWVQKRPGIQMEFRGVDAVSSNSLSGKRVTYGDKKLCKYLTYLWIDCHDI